jgi:CrcB protein
MSYLAVFIGGGLGSIARFSLSLLFIKLKWTNFPWATLVSNVLACLVLAFLVFTFKDKMMETKWLTPLLITGFCGGFSTFSTFGLESINLFHQGNYLFLALNVLLSIILGFGILFVLSKN